MELPKQTDLNFLNLVLPINDTTQRDCVCPVVVENGECTILKECNCINDTKFSRKIEVCLSLNGIYALKFNNLTKDLNTSRFQMFKRDTCPESSVTAKSKAMYMYSFEINEGINNHSVIILCILYLNVQSHIILILTVMHLFSTSRAT